MNIASRYAFALLFISLAQSTYSMNETKTRHALRKSPACDNLPTLTQRPENERAGIALIKQHNVKGFERFIRGEQYRMNSPIIDQALFSELLNEWTCEWAIVKRTKTFMLNNQDRLKLQQILGILFRANKS